MPEPSGLDKILEKVKDAIRKNNPDYAVQMLTAQVFKVDPNSAVGAKLFFDAVDAKWKGKALPKVQGVITLTTQKSLKRWDAVIEAAHSQYPVDPANNKIIEFLAEGLMNKKAYGAAVEVLRRLTTKAPENSLALYWFGLALKEVGDVDNALKAIGRAFDLDKTNNEIATTLKNMTALHTIKKSGMETAKGAQDILKNKDSAAAEVKKAKHMTRDEILAEIKSLGGIDSAKDRKAAQEIAELYEKAQEFAGAAKSWKKAHELEPTFVDALDRAGNATIKYYTLEMEKAEKAGDKMKLADLGKKSLDYKLKEYRRLVELRPTDLAVRFLLGSALYQNNSFKEAAVELQKAVKDPKRASEAALMLGRSFYEIGQIDMAIMQFDKTLADQTITEEGTKEARYWKAHALRKKGDKSAAKQLFMEIASEDIGFRDVDQQIKELG